MPNKEEQEIDQMLADPAIPGWVRVIARMRRRRSRASLDLSFSQVMAIVKMMFAAIAISILASHFYRAVHTGEWGDLLLAPFALLPLGFFYWVTMKVFKMVGGAVENEQTSTAKKPHPAPDDRQESGDGNPFL